MSFILWGVWVTLLGSTILLVVKGQHEEEWIDPTDMLLYDATSKTMRRDPQESKHKNNEIKTSVRNKPELEDNENPCSEVSCQRMLRTLQQAIQNVKLRADHLKDRDMDPEIKLAELVTSIQQLSNYEDDPCSIPPKWQVVKTFVDYISMSLVKLAADFMEFSDFIVHISPDSTPWLILPVIILSVCLYALAKCFRKTRKHEVQPGANDEEVVHVDNPADAQNDDHIQDDQTANSLDRPLNMVPENLQPEVVGGADDPLPEQVHVSDQVNDDCCDDNYEITKAPTAETQPAAQYSS